MLCLPVAAYITLFQESHSYQANEALSLSKAFNEKVLLPLRVEGPTLEVHFPLLNNCSNFLPDDFLWCFCGKDLSHANLLRATRRDQVERRRFTHLVGKAVAGRIVI